MPLNFDLKSLFSRQIARAREFASTPLVSLQQAGKSITRIEPGRRLKGFAVGIVFQQLPGLATWSISGLWSIFSEGLITLYYFDWNVPDATLDAQAQQRWQSYGSILGGIAGNSIGFFACGIVPSTSLFAFNERMAAYVLKEVSEEAFEELTFNASFTLRMTIQNLFRQSAGWAFKNVRKWLKQPGNPIAAAIFGDRVDQVRETWGEEGSGSWSFAQKVDERIEKIPSQFWQNFTEELIEEAMDACIEAGYVVADSIDSYIAMERLASRQTQGQERVIEIQPNRNNDREKIVLAGPEPQVRAALPIVLAQHQQIESRDVGAIIGEPLDDYVRQRPLGLRVKFKLYSVQAPPYARRGTQRLVEVTVTVPDVNRTKLDWDTLRLVCGGQNGYLWGRYRATARLTDGKKMTVYGGTEDEAEDRLKSFLTLSELEIETLNVAEEKREGERIRNPRLYKEPTRVYPGRLTIINRERQVALDIGRLSLDGPWIDKNYDFDLWRGVKPSDFEDQVRELLRRSQTGA